MCNKRDIIVNGAEELGLSKDDVITFLDDECKRMNKQFGEIHQEYLKYTNEIYEIRLELGKVRALQRHPKYEEDCPEEIKQEYNTKIFELVDQLLELERR
jgi:hypothetical protein